MAYDETLAGRIRDDLMRQSGIDEKKMFGGIGFLLHGNLLVGVWKDSLIARIGPEAYDAALQEPDVREFDVTGRSMTGWVLVGQQAIADDAALSNWIRRALAFVKTLPKKPGA